MFNRLDEREKFSLIIGVSFILFLLIILTVKSLYDYKQNLVNELSESRGNFILLEKAIQDNNYFKSIKSGDEEKISDIYTKLDIIMIRHSLKDRVQTLKDTNSNIMKDYNKITIDIQFRSVRLQDIIKMIYDIEVNKQINSKIDYISFRKPIVGKEEYDVNIKFSSYSKIGKKNG
jgi:general secretion pathway protein M